MKVICREEVQQTAIEMSGGLTESTKYIPFYQDAITKVYEELSEEKLAEFGALAKQWTGKGPPAAQQQRYGHSNCSSR